MPAIPVDALPPAPQRGSGSTDFSSASDLLLSKLPNWVSQMNALATYVSTAGGSLDAQVAAGTAAVTAMNGYLASGKGSADAAATNLANSQAYAAVAQSALGAPSTAGKTGKALMVGTGGALVWDSEIKIGDVVFSANNPGPFLPANGSIRSISVAPALASLVGSLGGTPAQAWTTIASGIAGTPVNVASNKSTGTVIVVFSSGAAMRSTDRGVTWTALTINAAFVTASDIGCDDNGTWVVVPNSAISAYRSTDDGLTWAAITINPTAAAYARISTDNNGTWMASMLAASTGIFRSLDNGVTWALVTTGTSVAHGQPATDGQGVWCVGAASGIRRSLDNGTTWTAQFAASGVQNAIATNRRGVWLSGGANGSYTYKSADNGLTWVTLGTPTTAAVTDIIYSLGFFILARAGLQVALLSENPDVISYQQPATGIAGAYRLTHTGNGILVQVYNAASTNVARSLPAYGYDPTSQFRVPDVPSVQGIQAWIKAGSRVAYMPVNFSAIGTLPRVDTYMAGDTDGAQTYIVYLGTQLVLLRSIDGGKTFTNLTTPATQFVTCLTCDKNGVWLAGTYSGQILRSADNGASWTSITVLGSGAIIRNIRAAVGNNIVICRTSTRMYRSTDRGLTWTDIGAFTTAGSMYDLVTDNAGNWLTSGSGSTLYRSTDHGLTWASVTWGTSGGNGVSLAFGSNGVAMALQPGTSSSRRSTDSGLTWVAGPSQGGSLMGSIIGSPSAGVFASYSPTLGYMSVSQDNGATFTSYYPAVPGTYSSPVMGEGNPWLMLNYSASIVYRSQLNPTLVA